jgi:hypothetical protein
LFRQALDGLVSVENINVIGIDLDHLATLIRSADAILRFASGSDKCFAVRSADAVIGHLREGLKRPPAKRGAFCSRVSKEKEQWFGEGARTRRRRKLNGNATGMGCSED